MSECENSTASAGQTLSTCKNRRWRWCCGCRAMPPPPFRTPRPHQAPGRVYRRSEIVLSTFLLLNRYCIQLLLLACRLLLLLLLALLAPLLRDLRCQLLNLPGALHAVFPYGLAPQGSQVRRGAQGAAQVVGQ